MSLGLFFTISKTEYHHPMKFGIRNTSFVYPGGTADTWEDIKTYIQR
jgi:hypothetical protein